VLLRVVFSVGMIAETESGDDVKEQDDNEYQGNDRHVVEGAEFAYK